MSPGAQCNELKEVGVITKTADVIIWGTSSRKEHVSSF
jgi:hypothetical protein